MFFNLETGANSGKGPCIHLDDDFFWINSFGQSSAHLGKEGIKKLAEAAKIQSDDFNQATNFKIKKLEVLMFKDEGCLHLEFYHGPCWICVVIKKEILEQFILFLEQHK